jgi:hypothetical protein
MLTSAANKPCLYQSQTILAETLDITPLAFPDCVVAIRALLPPMAPLTEE